MLLAETFDCLYARDLCTRLRLTLARGLEGEGLEASREGGGVDDINAVFTLALSVQRDGYDQQHHRHHSRSEAGIQGHITAALHACEASVSQSVSLRQ